MGDSLKGVAEKEVRMTLAFGLVVVAFPRRGCGKGSRFGWRMQLKHSVLDTMSSKCQ